MSGTNVLIFVALCSGLGHSMSASKTPNTDYSTLDLSDPVQRASFRAETEHLAELAESLRESGRRLDEVIATVNDNARRQADVDRRWREQNYPGFAERSADETGHMSEAA